MKKLTISLYILLGLFIVGSLIAFTFDSDLVEGNTAVVRITGPIMATSQDGLFSDSVAASTDIIEILEEVRDDPRITGVILEINSPGGTAVASDEIAATVKELDKPTVAWIREVGASGAYWIASSADYVVANRMSITGSIGVISSYIEFSEFLQEWNLTYNRLVAGSKKDIGDPFQELTYSDRAFLQEKLDTIHGFFRASVAENRGLELSTVEQLGDGRMFLGVEALEAGLVDELGGKNEAIAYVANATGEDVTLIVYEEEKGLFDNLFGVDSPLAETPVPLLR